MIKEQLQENFTETQPWLQDGPIFQYPTRGDKWKEHFASRQYPRPFPVDIEKAVDWQYICKTVKIFLSHDAFITGEDDLLDKMIADFFQRLENEIPPTKDFSLADFLFVQIALQNLPNYFHHLPHTEKIETTNIPSLIILYYYQQYGAIALIDLLIQTKQYFVFIDPSLYARHIFQKSRHNNQNKLRIFAFITIQHDSNSIAIKATTNVLNYLNATEQSIRALFSQLPEEEWQACVIHLTEKIDQIPLRHQPAFSMLFPDATDLAEHVLKNMNNLTAKQAPQSRIGLLTTSIKDKKLIDILYKETRNLDKNYTLAYINTILLMQKENTIPFLIDESDYFYLDDAIIQFNDPDAIFFVFKKLLNEETPSLKKQVTQTIKKFPLASILALIKVDQLNNKKSQVDNYLQPLLVNNSERLELLRPYIDSKAWDRVETLIQQHENKKLPYEEATIDELPQFLASPPWRQKKKKIKAPVFDLNIFPCEEINKITPELRVENHFYWDDYDYVFDPKKLKNDLKLITNYCLPHNAIQEKKECLEILKSSDTKLIVDTWKKNIRIFVDKYSGFSLDLGGLSYLPNDLAVPIWNEIANFSHMSSEVSYIVVKYGLQVKQGLLATFTHSPSEHAAIASHFGCVEFALTFAHLFNNKKKTAGIAKDWLLRFPEHAIRGLIPAALGENSKDKRAAETTLIFLAKTHKEQILNIAQSYQNSEVSQAINSLIDIDLLEQYPDKIAKLPDFWEPQNWHPLVLKTNNDEYKLLPLETVNHIGEMIRFPTNGGVYEGINLLKQCCTVESLQRFSWDLFCTWESNCLVLGDKWAMEQLSLFLDGKFAKKLVPYIQKWPNNSLKARAMLGLDILAEIGDEDALFLLNFLSFKQKPKLIAEAAIKKLTAIAETREINIENLRDQLIPNFDLDSNSSLVADFGSRQFNIILNKQLKPQVQDQNKKWLKVFPRANKDDDPEKAKLASEQFKQLKTDIQALITHQTQFFQKAMINKRLWDKENFVKHLVPHPIIRFLVQSLVWGVYTQAETGKTILLKTFRVDENFDFSDVDENPYSLPTEENSFVGLPHPLELTIQERESFRQIFEDYELIQLFPQINREFFELTEEEKKGNSLDRWHRKIVTSKRIKTLTYQTWDNLLSSGEDFVKKITKKLDGLELTNNTENRTEVVLDFSPGFDVYESAADPLDQKIGKLTIKRTDQQLKNKICFADLNSITVSEIIRNIELL